ncbi:MAG: hypothetical protein B7Z62_00240 [Deltaproteobacteria bacterium 37-65-8]|nr:MAG: hypothetical protein B7Z62_00240 [Deltaproteobacteria bacterium 37-65-8]
MRTTRLLAALSSEPACALIWQPLLMAAVVGVAALIIALAHIDRPAYPAGRWERDNPQWRAVYTATLQTTDHPDREHK